MTTVMGETTTSTEAFAMHLQFPEELGCEAFDLPLGYCF